MAVAVGLRVEGQEKAGEGSEEEKKESEHVCESLSSDAPAKLTSLHLVMCGSERETRCEYQISLLLRKGGQAGLGNFSCCLARS